MLGSFTTMGRRKMTSSVLVLLRLRELNSEPMIGMLLMIGIVSSMSLTESSIRPPSTATWPLLTLISDSISRMRSCGTGLVIPALASSGLGSFTNFTSRVVVGLTLRRIVSSSPICGVMFMTNPTGTVTGVVLVAVVAAEIVVAAARLTCTLKYTML